MRKTNLFSPLNTNPTKWSNTLKQFVGKLRGYYLGVFDHFVGLALKRLILEAKFDNKINAANLASLLLTPNSFTMLIKILYFTCLMGFFPISRRVVIMRLFFFKV